MGRLESRLLEHHIHQRISALRAAVEQLDESVIDAANNSREGVIDRVEPVLAFIEGALTVAEPALVAQQDLDAVSAQLDAATANVNSLPGDPAGHAGVIDDHLEAAVHAAGPLLMAGPLVLKRATTASRSIDTALTASVKESRDELARLRSELAQHESEQNATFREREQQNSQRSREQEQRTEALAARITEEESRLTSLLEQLDGRFEEKQSEHETEFRSLVEDSQTFLKKEQAQQNELLKKMVTEGQATLDQLADILAVSTDKATTGAFHKEANQQKDEADKWRGRAEIYGWLAAAIASAGLVIAVVSPDMASVGGVVTKVTAALAAAALATYAGRQAAQHRHREEEARRLEIELATFPAFIEGLEPQTQQEVRREFVKRAFVGRTAGNRSSDHDGPPTNANELFMRLGKSITDSAKE